MTQRDGFIYIYCTEKCACMGCGIYRISRHNYRVYLHALGVTGNSPCTGGGGVRVLRVQEENSLGANEIHLCPPGCSPELWPLLFMRHEKIEWTLIVVQPWVALIFADRGKSFVPCRAEQETVFYVLALACHMNLVSTRQLLTVTFTFS